MDQVPDTAQHFIVCDTESCKNFSEFYCNTCHQRVCDQCKQPHLFQNIEHQIVPYLERKRKLPSEKCRIHPTNDIDIYCDVCQDPLCFTCFSHNHSDHAKSDLETIYNDTLLLCQKEITDIWKIIIPGAKESVESLRNDTKKEIAKVRVSMKQKADELKKVVDSILHNNNKILDEIEDSVLDEIVGKQKELESYMKYLEKMIEDYERKMSSIKHAELMNFYLDISLASQKMPNIANHKRPIFTQGKLNQEEVAKQFGQIELVLSERFEVSSVTKVSEVTIQGHKIFHLSTLYPNKIWASDGSGNLIQSDMEGNILQKRATKLWNIRGNHTVTTEGELLYTDYNDENIVYKLTSDKSNKLIMTESWGLGAIYSSSINGHILVGMERNAEKKVTRYNREGRKLQSIQWDNQGQSLYQRIDYITENINGDICTSDSSAGRVMVVTASGEYRFFYSGLHSQSRFCPF